MPRHANFDADADADAVDVDDSVADTDADARSRSAPARMATGSTVSQTASILITSASCAGSSCWCRQSKLANA